MGIDGCSHKFFLNLSNHPIKDWSESQFAASREYGELADWPYPDIDPNCDFEDLDRLVDETVKSVMKKYGDSSLSIHVMGEMNSTYMFVRRFQELGIKCVASTSRRIVSVLGDGYKTVKFEFVRFREYF